MHMMELQVVNLSNSNNGSYQCQGKIRLDASLKIHGINVSLKILRYDTLHSYFNFWCHCALFLFNWFMDIDLLHTSWGLQVHSC